jgi:hypothetical protein
MSNQDINELLLELKKLRLEEEQIITAIEQACTTRDANTPPSSEQQGNQANIITYDHQDYQVGDRVYLLTDKKPLLQLFLGWGVVDNSRRGTVARVGSDKVFITTDDYKTR